MTPRVALAALVLAACAWSAVVPVAGAQPAPSNAPDVSAPHIIPRPNSGEAPRTATDRGGWAQYAVMAGIVVAIGGLALLVRRDARRAQARRQGSAASTRNEPVEDTSEKRPDPSALQ